jgi:hypothetical protein
MEVVSQATSSVAVRLVMKLPAFFQHYFEQVEKYYYDVTTSVAEFGRKAGLNLHLPIPEVPFTSYTFNVGTKSICQPHIDGSNLASGLCLVVPLGDFDPEQGGHIVLHDLGFVCEVAPGSLSLIPSATVTHSNIGIGSEEARFAITAYTPASYFQFFEEGFGPVHKRSAIQNKELGDQRWRKGTARFPHIDNFLTK